MMKSYEILRGQGDMLKLGWEKRENKLKVKESKRERIFFEI